MLISCDALKLQTSDLFVNLFVFIEFEQLREKFSQIEKELEKSNKVSESILFYCLLRIFDLVDDAHSLLYQIIILTTVVDIANNLISLGYSKK